MSDKAAAVHTTIAALNIYPIKSCRGVALDRATLGPTGFLDDRRWMVVGDTGRFVTQRETPRLALVVPAIGEHELLLAAPGMPDLKVSTQNDGARVEVTIWRDSCAAFDEGAHAAEWLSQFLGRAVRLVRFDPARPRPSDKKWTGDTEALNQFSDGFPLLAISQASLDDLNGRLPAPLPMNRFRPNLVLEGLRAYDEDRIHELAGGAVRLRVVKPCTRCKITTTEQTTGEVMAPQPLQTLRSYRWNAELSGVTFGQNVIVVAGLGAELHVGQRLNVTWK